MLTNFNNKVEQNRLPRIFYDILKYNVRYNYVLLRI